MGAGAIVLLSSLAACARGPEPRSLHHIDGKLVHSETVGPGAYAAYTRARLAMEAEPPRLEEARGYLEEALRFDSNSAHLWTQYAEILERKGEREAALSALQRALNLQPGDPDALALQRKMQGRGAGR